MKTNSPSKVKNMKYKATIKLSGYVSEVFDTLAEAMAWLDSQNNNMEHTTFIEEIDASGKVQDWFYYTKGV